VLALVVSKSGPDVRLLNAEEERRGVDLADRASKHAQFITQAFLADVSNQPPG